MPNKPPQWGSSWTLIMVLAGSTVGLSNIWWLPALAGNYGGGAFWVVYLLGLLVVGVPMIIAELSIGVAGQSDPTTSMGNLAVRSARGWFWADVGGLACIGGLLVAPLYVVVASWTGAYLVRSISGDFVDSDLAYAGSTFEQLLLAPTEIMMWGLAVLLVAMLISVLGVLRGLGIAARILVPLTLGIFVLVAYYSRHFGDIDATLSYLFVIDWKSIQWSTLSLALMHGIFSLGLGTGVIMTMGSYAPVKEDIPIVALTVVLVEFFSAMLAGYVIMPMIFAANIEPSGGVSLLFISVPVAFGSQLAGAYLTAGIYVAVLLAALTSLMALLEPAVAVISYRMKWARHWVVLLVGGVVAFVSWGCLMSFRQWHGVPGDWGHWFYQLDNLSRYVLPITGFMLAIFVGWIINSSVVKDEFEDIPKYIYKLWRFLLKVIALPVMLVVLYLHTMG
jgi:NSS family neurotransmitter:Na+ symporter|tara:strand:+ start:2606 stop:3949 length:1344 start_codon:yes stop_codon:yes gene_type:complete